MNTELIDYKSSYIDEISLKGLFLRSRVSKFQKSLANNFVTLRKIFSYSVVQKKISQAEYKRLRKFEMFPLEHTSAKTLVDELLMIIEWTSSKDIFKNRIADEIFEIRIKELKNFLYFVPETRRYEFKNGYIALLKYVEFIAN